MFKQLTMLLPHLSRKGLYWELSGSLEVLRHEPLLSLQGPQYIFLCSTLWPFVWCLWKHGRKIFAFHINLKRERESFWVIKWLRRPILWMSLSILLSHLCLCPMTQEQSSPGDKDGVSMSLATLNSTPEAGLAINTAECPYPNKGDWPWVLWGN